MAPERTENSNTPHIKKKIHSEIILTGINKYASDPFDGNKQDDLS